MIRIKFEPEGNVTWIASDQISTVDLIGIINIFGELNFKEIRFTPKSVSGYTDNLYAVSSEWNYEYRNFD